MGQSGEIAIDRNGAATRSCKPPDLPAPRLALSVVLPMPRFSSRVRAPAFRFRVALWQSHYAIPLPNASAPFVFLQQGRFPFLRSLRRSVDLCHILACCQGDSRGRGF